MEREHETRGIYDVLYSVVIVQGANAAVTVNFGALYIKNTGPVYTESERDVLYNN